MRASLIFGACALSGCLFQVDGVSGGMLVAPADAAMTAAPDDLGVPSDAPVADLAGSADLAPTPDPQLDVTRADQTGDINLTTIGTSDWAHYGLNAASDFDDKATGSMRISALTTVPAGGTMLQFGSNPVTFTWTDGATSNGRHATATASGSDVYVTSGGLQLNAPAGLTPRRLIVYVAVQNTQAQMQVALSDGSRPTYTDMPAPNDNTIHGYTYTIDYAAGAAGQLLTVTWSTVRALGANNGTGIGGAALTTK